MVTPLVECEEDVFWYKDANNGANPLWCYGSSCIVRRDDDVFVSGLETLQDVEPLNNVRWLLYKRTAGGWELQQRDEQGRTREPCPLGCFSDGRLLMSVNPAHVVRSRPNPAQPQILEFSARAPQAPYRILLPRWEGSPEFTEHSYRGLAVDGPNRELLLTCNFGYDTAYWSFLDRDGQWSAWGKIAYPWSDEHDVSLRLCYPVVSLFNRSALIFAVSDIVEPVKEWREHKFALTQREWDYVFRRLYYAWTPDITAQPFGPWVEIANYERTAGHLHNLDVWVAHDGAAHLLWREVSLDVRLRERFFPDAVLTVSLEHGIVREGQLVYRQTLLKGGEGLPGEIVAWGRFQATPEGRLFVFYSVARGEDWHGAHENYLMEILPDGGHGVLVKVELTRPFIPMFMTATERAGSPPSTIMDVLGWTSRELVIRYARVKLL